MTIIKRVKVKGVTLLVLIIALIVNSCDNREQEREEQAIYGDANIIVNILGSRATGGVLSSENKTTPNSGPVLTASMKGKTNQKSFSDTEEIQTKVIKVDQHISVIATLVPESLGELKTNNTPILAASSSKPSVGSPMAATVTGPVQTPLAPGVRYRVVVYNKSTGNFVTSKEYVFGQESTTPGIALDGETEYTFIAYSINSTATGTAGLPDVPAGNLTTASLANISGDLMYFRKDLVVKKGDNHLDVVLEHQFSQITTSIELSDDTAGALLSITSTLFNPTRVNASIKMSNGVLTYGSVKSGGQPVVFPAIAGGGVRTIQSAPTLLISPDVSNAELSIGATSSTGQQLETSITNNMLISGLKITPGRKYNLNLKFVIPCLENVNVSANNIFDWALSENEVGTIEKRTLSAPAADFGFVFDILELDNSFNMTINGVNLLATGPNNNTNNEVQFEVLPSTAGTERPRNIMFADGTEYVQGPPWNHPNSLWNIIGTTAKPSVRLVISAEGKVSMYGSKVSQGPLYPLKLKPGWSFNTITWNKTGANTVTISQHRQYATAMKGSGYGKKTVLCQQ